MTENTENTENVASGVAGRAVMCRRAGSGASIATEKARGVRAAPRPDAVTASGARPRKGAGVSALRRAGLRPASARRHRPLGAGLAKSRGRGETGPANIAYLSKIEN